MRDRVLRLLAALSTPAPQLTLLRAIATTVLELVGVAAIAVGVFLIWVPAGFIIAGALLLLVSWRATR